jgi:hypothetical protein
MEIKFWQTVGIDPYYMYIDDTINLVDDNRVSHNRELMSKVTKVVTVDKDEFYEFDVDGDLTSLVFD